jgi:hypothetical protein
MYDIKYIVGVLHLVGAYEERRKLAGDVGR